MGRYLGCFDCHLCVDILAALTVTYYEFKKHVTAVPLPSGDYMHPLTCASRSDHAHRVASAASIYVTMHGFISSLETIMWATLLLSFVLKFCHAACPYDGWGYYALLSSKILCPLSIYSSAVMARRGSTDESRARCDS